MWFIELLARTTDLIAHEAPDYIGAHRIKHAHFYFIIFMPSILGMWDRLNSPIRYLSFASFNAPYDPVRLMYEKRTVSIQFLILHLIFWCALWSEK